MRAILTYEDTGTIGVSGQTVGANGAGEFCIIYNGEEEKIHDAAREFIANLHKRRRLGKFLLVYDQEVFFGKTVNEIDV